MHKFLLFNTLTILGIALVVGCSNDEAVTQIAQPPEIRTWNVSVDATGTGVEDVADASSSNRAIFYGGNSGHRYSFIWDTGDRVDIYKGDTPLGTLIPTVYGSETTTLSGTLTGDIAVDDVLTLYFPARAYDYTGQDGMMSTISQNKSFQESSTTVVEAKESGNTLTLNATTMTHAQSYWWLRLFDENNVRLHPTKIEIYADGGQLVKTKAVDGTTTYFTDDAPFTINTTNIDESSAALGEYPPEAFVAIRNEKATADTYNFKVWVGEDVYYGPYDRALTYKFANGVLNNVKRQVLKTTAASTLTVLDIADQTFTGYAIEPAVTVTDTSVEPAATLTLDTDYSVSYTNNTNVGEATATVTGLADAGSVAATKYLGTKDKTFNIVKATPVIEMPSLADMTLEVGLTRQRAVTGVTIDNSAYSLADLDILSAPYSCGVAYSSDDEAVATVDADGTVHGVATGTTTIHVTVATAANWNAQQVSYTVKVSPRVNTSGTSVWTVTEDAEDSSLYQ